MAFEHQIDIKKFPGLLMERHRNGAPRYRVRVEGNPEKRISLDICPSHPCFVEAYYAARAGIQERFAHCFVPVVAQTGDLNGHIRAILHNARERARLEGVKFSITKNDILAKIDQQMGRCAISNVPFNLAKGENRRRPFAISLDRISCGGDYSSDNVRLTSVIANLARSDWGDEILSVMAKGIFDAVSRTP